ncbi:MAG: hypothetical protein EAZ76_16375 [Nostocales cyanobacterium]|nr:MAG: hypothetical protein EAZ87_11705 [Nostocales cyanobacterium]TAF09282.1 MAG: hypothetical protein EAZ76_16375 [Nostocales cyanobacterium]
MLVSPFVKSIYLGLAVRVACRQAYKCTTKIDQRLEGEQEEKSARFLKVRPEKPCILGAGNPKIWG